MTVSGGARKYGEAYTFDGDTPLIGAGPREPLEVTVFPINGDGSPTVARYIAGLREDHFKGIDEFMAREGERYQVLSRRPTLTRLGPTIDEIPPPPPGADANPVSVALWSLRLRYWAHSHTPDEYSGRNRVAMFVLYHEGRANRHLEHSLGLQKGLIGVVHAFAEPEQAAQNNIVIAHELLHTVGAADKYDARGHPRFPDGYARPDKDPLHPQNRAEIMAGRIAVSASKSKMAASLRSSVIGETTAREINWIGDQI